ncbi:MAG TPA: LytTR family DNA-binding domain-containing protein [Chryseosolibacter sp.]
MRKLSTVICDDEPLVRESLESYLKEYEFIDIVDRCQDGFAAIEAVNSKRPDLLFLDISMPELNGFDVLKKIDPSIMPTTIFVTAYDEFALKAFDANAIDYILKPVEKSRLQTALKKAASYIVGDVRRDLVASFGKAVSSYEALSAMGQRPQNYMSRILIKDRKKYFFVPIEEVLWFEADSDYVIVHTPKGNHLIYETLTNLESKLDPSIFVRIHRSTVVNIHCIESFEPYFNSEYFITLKNKEVVKLSRNYKDKIKILFHGSQLP